MSFIIKLGSGTALLMAASLSATMAMAEDSACKPKHELTTIVPGTLTVAVVTTWPTIDVKDGKLIGFEGEILNDFAKTECLKIDAQQISGAGIIPAVQAKRVDIATGGWYRSKRRAEIVALSDPTMKSQVALITKGDYKTFGDVKGHSIGTPQGNLWVDDAQAYFGDDLKIYQSFDQVYADLRAGRIEVGLVPYELAKRAVDDGSIPGAKFVVPPGVPEISTSVTPPQVGFPHVLGNPAFTTALNDDIREMHQSGFITKALKEFGLPQELGDTGVPYLIP